jgi:hypothetical protein
MKKEKEDLSKLTDRQILERLLESKLYLDVIKYNQLENNLSNEENIILNVLLDKRGKYNSIKPAENKIEKETKNEIYKRLSKVIEVHEELRFLSNVDKNPQSL